MKFVGTEKTKFENACASSLIYEMIFMLCISMTGHPIVEMEFPLIWSSKSLATSEKSPKSKQIKLCKSCNLEWFDEQISQTTISF